MDSDAASHRRSQTTPQSIPLQDLTRPPEAPEDNQQAYGHRRTLSDRGRRLLESGLQRAASIRNNGFLGVGGYAPISSLQRQSASPFSHRAGPVDDQFDVDDDGGVADISPLVDRGGFQEAMGFAGLTFAGEHALSQNPYSSSSALPARAEALDNLVGKNDSVTSFEEHQLHGGSESPPTDSDTAPLTDTRNLQPMGTSMMTPSKLNPNRESKVRFSMSGQHGGMLGDDLVAAEAAPQSLSPDVSRRGSRSRSPRSLSPSAESSFQRVGTIMRRVSQRVVNLSNEPEVAEADVRRRQSQKRKRTTQEEEPVPNGNGHVNGFVERTDSTSEKSSMSHPRPQYPKDWVHTQNPLRGKTLGIFSPTSRIRTSLCNLLTHPITEPIILLLIVAQTVLLAIDSGTDIHQDKRPAIWNSDETKGINLALIILFTIYTLEIVARVIVSGFAINPVEYSTINRAIGLRKALAAKSKSLFALSNEETNIMAQTPSDYSTHVFKAFNLDPSTGEPIGAGRAQQRWRLAHRAFLRHSFNRLDFVAVVSFWISLSMAIANLEHNRHFYLFRMLSCLRILRLLSLTSGTSIILRSLKKAAPLLLNVALLIGFFWLLFAIIGVQSFKSSLRRTCVWIDPLKQQNDYALNQTGNFQFCGGSLAPNGTVLPWVFSDGTSSGFSKGYLCPPNSMCISANNPYNGTVSFDNIVQSLELVFVIMTGNTYSDLMYYLADSDYLVSTMYFAAGVVVMTFWLINLLIAVITSSFQIIREESKTSAFANLPNEEEQLEIETSSPQSQIKRLYGKTRWFWLLVIAYDLIAQALRSASMSSHRAKFISVSETVVTFILLFEILIRFAVDWRNFFGKKQNWVDLGLAIITTVMQIPKVHDSGQPYAWLSIFQILRVYRIVLGIPWTRDLILLVLGNVSGIFNLIVFVFLLTFLVAIFASQLFRGEIPMVDSSGSTTRVTFATIFNCFLGMYQILSSENWTTILYDVTFYEVPYGVAWIGAIFCILWFILGFFIVLNMFIAVIQENFDVSEDEKRLQQVKAFLQRKELGQSSNPTLSLSALFKLRGGRRQDALDYGPQMMEQLLKEAVVRDFLDDNIEASAKETPTPTPVNRRTSTRPLSAAIPLGPFDTFWLKISKLVENKEPNPFYSRIEFSRIHEDLDPRTMAQEVVSAADARKRAQRDYLARHPNYNTSLFLFKPDNIFRRMCMRMVGPGRGTDRIEGAYPSAPIWYAFSAFLYLAILAMVLLACVTTPLFEWEHLRANDNSVGNWFVWTDFGFAVLFSVEAVIRIIADGFFFTPHAYLRSSWGFIDALVLVTLWINVGATFYNDGAVSRAVGAFKALRALRLLNVSDSARETFHSVIVRGGWKVLSAAFVSLSLLIPFAIYGLNLFNGRLESCNDSSSGIFHLADCVGEFNSSPYNWDVVAPRLVSNPYFDFDDFGNSLFILFQIVSQEGWIDVMWAAESITGVFTQPEPFASQHNAVFFVIFNLLGAVFVLTLFISVFMRNYTEQTGVAYLTTDQRSWLELRKLLRQISPSKRPSANKSRTTWAQWCYRLSVRKTGRWQRFVTLVLCFHLLLLCLEFYPTSNAWDITRTFLFLGLTIFFMVNIGIRITGLTWTRFRKNSWDVYSLLAIGGTFISTVVYMAEWRPANTTIDDSEAFSVSEQAHKLFLVSIVLLLIPRNNQLDQLFKTAAASLTAIANLLATWFVLFLVYAIAFTQTFGLTRFGPNEQDNVNFRNVPKALILLFRLSTGEGWNQLMEDFANIVPPYCTNPNNFLFGDCGSPTWARVLFVSWNILSMYIFVNMFISLIYESFSYVYQRSSGLSAVSRDEIRRFKSAWAVFDPEGRGSISKEDFPRLLGELSGVFDMRIYQGEHTVGSITRDCRKDNPRTSQLPIDDASERNYEIDLERLNERLATLPVGIINYRRRRLNLFYEEVMNSLDTKGEIGFTALLMILAHYKVINDNKSLRLEEFLRRRARLQRVEDDVRRAIVSNFLDTIHWKRRFRRTLDGRKMGRMESIPILQIPEIYVDDEAYPVSPEYKRASDYDKPALSLQIPMSRGRVAEETSGRSRSSSIQRTPVTSTHGVPSIQSTPNPFLGGQQHTRSISNASYASSHLGAGEVPDRTSLDRRRESQWSGPPSPIESEDEALAFYDGNRSSGGSRASRGREASGQGGGSSTQNVLNVLEDSAWGQSIRKSMTMRRSGSRDDRRGGGGGSSAV